MLQKNSFIKKFTIFLVIALMFVMQHLVSALSLLNFSKKDIFAETESDAISISNSNFTNYSGNLPADPSSFNAEGTKGSTISGVIDTDVSVFQSNYENNYKLNFNPSYPQVSNDTKVLMINNQNINSNYGYASTTFNLPANGYYVVSTYVYTQYNNISSTASLYLSNDKLDNISNSKIENISTHGVWKEYRFYIQTSSSDETVNLVLYIGTRDNFKSAGAVFFDNLSAKSLSETNYFDQISNTNIDYKEIILAPKDVSVNNGITDGDFDKTTLTDFTKVSTQTGMPSTNNVAKIVGIGEYFNSEESNLIANPTDANRLNNKYALLINNSTADYVAFESNEILIEQHKLYRLSVDVKTSNFSKNGANLTLTQINPFNSDKFTPVEESITNINTSNETNALTNNWITYSFLIQGNVFKDSFAKLTLSVGNQEELTSGYAFFDNIVLEEITSSDYDSNSSNANVKTVDFSNLSTTPTVANAYFNNVEIETTTDAYPYSASNITVTNNNDKNFNGIFNVNTNKFNAQNFPFTNPVSVFNSNSDLSYNNVFVLANTETGFQSAKTSTFSLSASSYYKVSIYVNTQNIINNEVSVVLSSDNIVLGQVKNIETDNIWKEISFVVKTYEETRTCNLTLNFGSEITNNKGYVFFDNISVETIEEEDYTNFTSNSLSYKTDLSKIDLNITSSQTNNNYYEALNFTGKLVSEEGNVEAGIINVVTHPSLNVGYVTTPNVLTIHNITDAHYELTSNGYKLTSGNYYKISVSVKTLYLNQEELNKQLDDDGNVIEYGANISLSGLSESFNAIKTENDYVTYTFYVSADSETTVKLILSLGAKNALARGYAFFDNMSFETIDADAFTQAQDNLTEDDTTTLIIGSTTAEDDEDDSTITNPSEYNFDWLVIPTLIITLALLVALAGLLLRKVNIKLPTRVRVSEYDRAKTIVKEHNRREIIRQREERLQALREKLEELQQEITETKKQYSNTKLEKAEIQQEYKVIDEKIKETYSDVQSVEARNESKRLKLEAKKAVKQARRERYILKRTELMNKYLEIEKEIDMILEEERLLVEEYKAYRKQLKLQKKEAKLNKKYKR